MTQIYFIILLVISAVVEPKLVALVGPYIVFIIIIISSLLSLSLLLLLLLLLLLSLWLWLLIYFFGRVSPTSIDGPIVSAGRWRRTFRFFKEKYTKKRQQQRIVRCRRNSIDRHHETAAIDETVVGKLNEKPFGWNEWDGRRDFFRSNSVRKPGNDVTDRCWNLINRTSTKKTSKIAFEKKPDNIRHSPRQLRG